MIAEIRKLVDQTPFIDTHEHLWEESSRLQALKPQGPSRIPAPDFSMLFCHYAEHDLLSAGMPQEDLIRLFSYEPTPKEKWKLVARYYDHARYTGYLQCTRRSMQAIVKDVDDFDIGNIERISEHIRNQIRPGFYKTLLKKYANIEYCQVNSLEDPVFMESEQPELLAQDMSFLPLAGALDINGMSARSGISVSSLSDWHDVIDWCFNTYAGRAVAIKSQAAYLRRLDYAPVTDEEAGPLFERYISNPDNVSDKELKAIQDHCFHYCVRRAVQYKLPIKLHTGYYAGTNGMPLQRVRQNFADLCPILTMHRDATFILMHIGWPYQDEAIAIAKHFDNAIIDCCWAWLINPLATQRFVKEFLITAPSNKLLLFGGDFMPVELVVGHAEIARQGLAQAVSELVEEGWLTEPQMRLLVDEIMQDVPHRLFRYEEKLAAW